jgi:hypothetical protein
LFPALRQPTTWLYSKSMRTCAVFLVLVLAAAAGARQSGSPPKSVLAAGSAQPSAQANHSSSPEFITAADQVLLEMSKILSLPIKQPLKKSLRSKQEVRDYLVREDKEDKTDAERYADEKTLEAFGLIPKNFPLDSFMLDVLTDQVAGLYDPKGKEFYIADWIPVDEQRTVMSHELTHALEDQSFSIDSWIKAGRPNDDAELARDSVSEGSAMAAMVDYQMLDQHIGVRELPDVTLLIRAGAISEMDKDPNLAKAPIYIRDELLFPYLAGTGFTQEFLKAHTGWKDIHLIFENPPVSTQQILHPDLYLSGTKPEPVVLPAWKGLAPDDWKLLEENTMGEFGVGEILKQFKKDNRDDSLSAAWKGDRYAVFEDAKSKATPVVFRIALDTPEDAARFFGQYSEALELKHSQRTNLFRRPNFFQFQTDSGGVFLRCVAATCLTVEGATRETYDKINKAVGWDSAPVAPTTAPESQTLTEEYEGKRPAAPLSSSSPLSSLK